MARTKSNIGTVARGERRECCETVGGQPHSAECSLARRSASWRGRGRRNLLNYDYARGENGNVLLNADGIPIYRLRSKDEVKVIMSAKHQARLDGRCLEHQITKSLGLGDHRFRGGASQ